MTSWVHLTARVASQAALVVPRKKKADNRSAGGQVRD